MTAEKMECWGLLVLKRPLYISLTGCNGFTSLDSVDVQSVDNGHLTRRHNLPLLSNHVVAVLPKEKG